MRSAHRQVQLSRLGKQIPVLSKANSLSKIMKLCVLPVCLLPRLSPGRVGLGIEDCSGKIRLASRRCTTVLVAPLAVKKYKLPFFRPLCPAFSFADVDTHANGF